MNTNLIETAEALVNHLNNPLVGTLGWYERALAETGAEKFFCKLVSEHFCAYGSLAYALTHEYSYVIVEYFHSKGWIIRPVERG